MKEKIFDEVLNYNDLCDVVACNAEGLILSKGSKYTKKEGISSLKRMPIDRQSNMINIAKKIDKEFNPIYNDKIITILSSSIYYNKYYSSIKDLNNDEIILLGHFSNYLEEGNYLENLKLYNKEILGSIINKCDNYMGRENILVLVEDMFDEFDISINSNIESLRSFQNEMVSFINKTSLDDMDRLYLEYTNRIVKYMEGVDLKK